MAEGKDLAKVEIDLLDPVQLAIAGFLARYGEPTRTGYFYDLRDFFRWCEQANLHVFETVKRAHIEVWARDMETRLALSTVKRRISTVAGFYKFANIDGFIGHNPAAYVRRPSLDNESSTLGLDRMELGGLLAVAAGAKPMDHALICLLGIMGLRVSEACGIHIEDLGQDRGHRTVRILGKGHKRATMAMPPRVFRAIDLAVDNRPDGPVLLSATGLPMTRDMAGRVVKRQIFARHADPRTTTRYDRARNNLDRSATYVISAFLVGGS